MAAIPGKLMGYDRAITVFSPDGRLLQVEYARKTVEQGTSAIGVVCSDGIVLAADKRVVEKLVVPESIEKVMQIDKHIGVTMSGLISDGRTLVQRAQEESQNHKLLFDEPIDILTLTKEIGDHKQMFTQYAGLRPFGVSLLIGGVDEKPRLFVTEPSGIFFEYKATAIGKSAEEINKILEKKYKENMELKDGIKLCLHALKRSLGSKFDKERIDIAIVPLDKKEFRRLSQEEIDKSLKKK